MPTREELRKVFELVLADQGISHSTRDGVTRVYDEMMLCRMDENKEETK